MSLPTDADLDVAALHVDETQVLISDDRADDAFASALGTRRGHIMPPHPKVMAARAFLAAGNLAGACRLVSRHGITHDGLLFDLADALAKKCLHDRWSGRVRLLLDWTAAYSDSAHTIVNSSFDASDSWIVHLWPDGENHLWAHQAKGSVTACGAAVTSNDMAPRGAWMNPQVCGRKHPQRWRRCRACAPYAADLPETRETGPASVFEMKHFLPVVTAMRETLLSRMLYDQRNATIANAREMSGFSDDLILRAVARTASDGGYMTWRRALSVKPTTWSGNLSDELVRRYLPFVEDPSALLDEHDWLDALNATITLQSLRGYWSPKQTKSLRKMLWRRTLQNFHGVADEEDGEWLDGYSVCF